jgi:phosphoribosylformylglycinamidine synthase
VFPGSNCDNDVRTALNSLDNFQSELIWHTNEDLTEYDAIVLPGGFSYGDRLRAGIIAAHSPIMKHLKKSANSGTPILGICNGFQILIESGLLPGGLLRNESLNFICQWTKTKIINNDTPFTKGFKNNQVINIPIAHGEGRYVFDEIEKLRKHNQIVLQYHQDINGSLDMIAGICNEDKNVVGLMPHPERASFNYLSPEGLSNDGLNFFLSLIKYLN